MITSTNRLDSKFSDLGSRHEAGLVTFVTAGDPWPSVERSAELIVRLAEAGADVIELGIPYSDPLADGPSIQAASQRALDAGVTPPFVLETVRLARKTTQVPIVLMTYYNPVWQFGLERFATEATQAGVDGVILTDLPPDEAGPWLKQAERIGLATIFLLAPTSTPGRIEAVSKVMHSGFIYCVSRTGVTGVRRDAPSDLKALIGRIREASHLPVGVGFGISTPEHVATIAQIADAVVIGSALVDYLHSNVDDPAALESVCQVSWLMETGHNAKVSSMYTRQQFGKMIDNTLLRPDATHDDVARLIEESAERHLASVCVFPCWVGFSARMLKGSDVKVCTVVSFPFGADTRAVKSFAVRNAIVNGAQEVDVVMNISRLKSGDLEGVTRDISEVLDGVRNASGGGLHSADSRKVLCKIIIETAYLTNQEKEVASRIVRDCGADFVKTSSGTAPSGATTEDIRLIRRAIGPGSIGIKASGGIRTVDQAVSLLNAGANRIGTSCGAAIFDNYRPDEWAK